MDLKEGTHIQEQAIYTVKNLENCDWKIVGVCYVDEMITEKVSSAVSRLLIVLCLVMGAVFLLGWAFSELFSAPVRQLADDMHRFEKMLKILYLSRWRELQRSRLYPTHLNTWL
mgnify:CR=1 FL=1